LLFTSDGISSIELQEIKVHNSPFDLTVQPFPFKAASFQTETMFLSEGNRTGKPLDLCVAQLMWIRDQSSSNKRTSSRSEDDLA
jgi:hypothetical protein